MNELISTLAFIQAFAALLLGFSFIIFVHELGHFLVAKWVGIKVTQFAIGFGHCVFAWRKGIGFRKGSTEPEHEQRLEQGAPPASMGETEYRLNWMPLGGYVKMLGQEDLNPDAQSDDPRSYNSKPVWARMCVISAGVVMNMIFSVIFFVIAFSAGVEFPPAIVGGVYPDSPADQSYALGHEGDASYQGLEPGDRITHIDGQPTTDFTDIAVKTALSEPGQQIQLTVQRDDEPQPLMYLVVPEQDPNTNLLAIGITKPVSLDIAPPSKLHPLPPALAQAGVEPGMQVLDVDNQPVQRYDQFNKLVSDAQGQPVQVRFAHAWTKNQPASQTVTTSLHANPVLATTPQGLPHLLGWVPTTRVRAVIPGSAAAKANVLPGDLLARVGEVAWPSISQVIQVVSGFNGRAIPLTVFRDGQTVELTPATPNVSGQLGVMLQPAVNEPIVSQTITDTPAATLNMNQGSVILAIDSQPVQNYADIQRLITRAIHRHGSTTEPSPSHAPPDTATVTVRYVLNILDAPTTESTVVIGGDFARAMAQARWSEPLGQTEFDMLTITVGDTNPLRATMLGVRKTHQFMVQTYLTLARLFQGTVKPEHLQGPVGIVDTGTRVAKQGWSYLMFFLGLISVNLAVFNFLPIPIVDGGHMVFLIIEKLKGSPVSARVQHVATMVGLAMIGSVVLLTLYYDVGRIAKQWFGL